MPIQSLAKKKKKKEDDVYLVLGETWGTRPAIYGARRIIVRKPGGGTVASPHKHSADRVVHQMLAERDEAARGIKECLAMVDRKRAEMKKTDRRIATLKRRTRKLLDEMKGE